MGEATDAHAHRNRSGPKTVPDTYLDATQPLVLAMGVAV
jgi:hypothetical protein